MALRTPILTVLLCLIISTVTARADELQRLTLPLDGCYRPGRFMPVVLSLPQPHAEFKLYGKGIVTVRGIGDSGGPRLLAVPVVGRPDPKIGLGGAELTLPAGPPWREIPLSQPLIGVVGSESIPADLPAGPQAIVQHVPAPLPSAAACAWNALDWLVIPSASANALGSDWLADLIASGVSVYVTGDAPPAGGLPWRTAGEGFSVTAARAGMISAGYSPDVYLPADVWEPHRPAHQRQQIVAAAIAVGAIITACILGRRRGRAVRAAMAAGTLAVGVAVWSLNMPGLSSTAGQIVVADTVTRVDTWTYVTDLSAGNVHIPWQNALTPVFASESQLAAADVELLYAAGEPVGYDCRLNRGVKLAMVGRSLQGDASARPVQKLTASPLRAVAESLYLSPGWALVGQYPAGPPEEWPTLIVRSLLASEAWRGGQ